jgi:Peptidase family C25
MRSLNPSRSILALVVTVFAGCVVPGRAAAGVPVRDVLGHPIQYVVITEDSLVPAFLPLTSWKTHSGIPAVVEPLSEIRSSYPLGADDAERVRLFLQDVHVSWGVKWALLGGDTTIVPTRLATTTFFGGAALPTDLYFSCLLGNWDANGNGIWGEGYQSASAPGDDADLVPDIYVGRAPVGNRADVARFVLKTLLDEITPAGDRGDRMLGAGTVLFPVNWSGGPVTLDGAELIEEDLPTFDLDPAMRVARLYQNDLEPSYRAGAFHETHDRVVDSLAAGQNLTLMVAPGTDSTLSLGDAPLTRMDLASLPNVLHPFHLYSIGGSITSMGAASLGRAAMLSAGGAVSVIAADAADFPTTTRGFEHEFSRLLFQQNLRSLGELHARSKLPQLPFSTFDGVNRWVEMDLTLFGDPEMQLRLRQAQALDVTAPASIAFGDTSFDVHVGLNGADLAGARVTAYRPGRQLSIALTDAGGMAHVPYIANGRDTLDLTVVADDCRPYQLRIPIEEIVTATLADLVDVEAGNGEVRLTWSISGRPGAAATLYRHRSIEARQAVQSGYANGVGRIELSDRDVHPGDRWAYSLGIASTSGVLFTADTWIDVPVPQLAFDSPGPNPNAGRFELIVTLPRSSPIRLEILDVAGRSCAVRAVPAAEAGAHRFAFDLRGSAPAGIYFARLSAADRVLTHRFAIVR